MCGMRRIEAENRRRFGGLDAGVEKAVDAVPSRVMRCVRGRSPGEKKLQREREWVGNGGFVIGRRGPLAEGGGSGSAEARWRRAAGGVAIR